MILRGIIAGLLKAEKQIKIPSGKSIFTARPPSAFR